jgi:microcin C transport system substrate-binding protein
MLHLDRRSLIAGLGSTAIVSSLAWTRIVRAETGIEATHGISMYGDLKYAPGFEHFDYVNPDAPKGGVLIQEGLGTYDSFNPFILGGTPAGGVGLMFETLTTRSLDEPFSEYGLLAEAIIVPEDRSWVAFDLHPEARWHDGRPVTAEDVIWSFETLTTKGHPRFRYYYASVVAAEQSGDRQVTFRFDGKGVNRELPLIMGQLPVLPKHFYEVNDFERNTLQPPIGSGPYRIGSFDAGRSIEMARVRDYWGADLPVNRGRYNFDEVRLEYYRDRDVSLEAFKAGRYDLRVENSAKRWSTAYTGPAVERGLIKMERLDIPSAARMQGWIFNLRRPIFQDRRIREAIGYAFDFEWSNQALFYGHYERIKSYFHGEKTLMATGLPSASELALLEPWRDRLPPEVFNAEFEPPKTDGSGNIRDNLREAFRLAREAGWEVQNGVLTERATGQRMEFEILLSAPDQERVAGPFVQNLARLGVNARLRTVDPSQYQNRTDAFEFDMIVDLWAQSSSPGNEQRDYWGSEAADQRGSRNTIGIRDPAVDAMIEHVIRAESREELEIACRALDRVLLWGHYVVPHFTLGAYWVAYWDKFGRPAELPTEGPDFFAWWVDQGRSRIAETEQEKVKDTAPVAQ